MDQTYEFQLEGDDPTQTIIIGFAAFMLILTLVVITVTYSMFLDEAQQTALARRASITTARADLSRFALQRREWRASMRDLAPSDAVLLKRADALAADIDAADTAWHAAPRRLAAQPGESVGFVATALYLVWMAPASRVAAPAERKALARLARVYEQLLAEMRTVKGEMDLRLIEQDRRAKTELLREIYQVLKQSEGGGKAFAAFGSALSDDNDVLTHRARDGGQTEKALADD